MNARASSSWWSTDVGGISVSVRVTPGASATEVVGTAGDRLRIRVAAPASGGAANRALRTLIAERFGVRRSAVSVVRGEHAREKTVRIAGLTAPPPEIAGGR